MSDTTIQKENIGARLAGKYLTFSLGKEAYAVGVLKVKEIIRHQKITPVPQMPMEVKGIINLRGKIIPIIDTRSKFGLPEVNVSESTCIIVVQVVGSEGQEKPMGLIVDGVEEVANVSPTEIEDTPDFGHSVDTYYILGLAKTKGKVITLLDIQRLVGNEVLDEISGAMPS